MRVRTRYFSKGIVWLTFFPRDQTRVFEFCFRVKTVADMDKEKKWFIIRGGYFSEDLMQEYIEKYHESPPLNSTIYSVYIIMFKLIFEIRFNFLLYFVLLIFYFDTHIF